VKCIGALAALLILGACNGSFDDRVREQVHRSIETGAAPVVRVDNAAGSVTIRAQARNGVSVDATKYGSDLQEVRNVAVTVRATGEGIAIATSYGDGMHGGGVRYRIVVPAGASVQVSNLAGAVDVTGVRGNIDVATQAGEITVDAGRVAGDRSISLRATTGAVKLTVARQSSARVEAYSTVGDFSTDVPGVSQQRQNIVGARGSGTIGSGSGRISLNTTTGAIVLFGRP